MFKKGDTVAVIDDNIEGIVVSVNGKEIVVETNNGFMLKFMQHELITICNNASFKKAIGNIDIETIKKEKEASQKKKSLPKLSKSRNEIGVPDFDLHIEKLVPSSKGMTNYDILTLQINTAKKHIEFAIRNRIPKIVFIHGVGEGVLKSELEFLFGRYENVVFQDADYRRYGFGATELYFKQSKIN